MAETKKSSKTAKQPTRKNRAVERDSYDDFLDIAEGKLPKSGTNEKPASSKKTAGSASSKSSQKISAARKKTSVEPGIGMLEASDNQGKDTKKAKPESGSKKKPASSAARGASGAAGKAVKSAGQRPKRTPQADAVSAAKRPGASSRRKSARVEPNPLAARSSVHYVNNDDRDEFDDFMDRTEPVRASKKKRKKKGSMAVCLMLLCTICVMVLLGVWQNHRYQQFLVMKAAVERQSFYEGTLVEGVNVSTMTLEQAIQHWETQIEPAYSQRTVTLTNGASFTAAELGYFSDYRTVLANAYGAGRSGSLEERYQAISSRLSQPVSYSVTRRAYDEGAVLACVNAIAQQINMPASDAKIESFDVNSYEFVFKDEVVGSSVNTEQLVGDIKQTLESGGGAVEVVVEAIQPKVKKSEIASQYGLIDYAVTNASSSSSNRLANIKLALSLINGTCLKPGETFSFNEIVGKRTSDRGFKMATAYSGGEVTEDIGGGICQVSTTLFNAVVKSDLEIVERHNHSLTVSYVDKGKDAAVNWNSQDLRFTNNTGDNIYICCYLTDDKRVRVGVFGKKIPNGEYITIEGVTTGTIRYDTVYQVNLGMRSGQKNTTKDGRNGYTASAYKIRWDANGNQISKELLCKSSYKAIDRVVEYGP